MKRQPQANEHCESCGVCAAACLCDVVPRIEVRTKVCLVIHLLVPDGTWRQARKIQSRHPELRDLPRVKISTPNTSIFQLRAQSKPERMATLQAIAEGLGIIEGDVVRVQLMKLYHAKIERTLKARGIIIG